MQIKIHLAAALLTGIALYAQNEKPPAAVQTPAPVTLKPHAYVRRISAGATLSVLALPIVKEGSASSVTISPVADSLYYTEGMLQRIGWGGQAQAAVTERFAVNVGFLVRRVGYKMNTDTLEGTDNPNTPQDDRIHTVNNEDTRAKFFDFPVVVRYYGKDRHEAGARWFVEGGAALRQVSRIKTAIDTTVGAGDTVCCDNTRAVPARRTIRGFVGGFGVQLIDPVGVRVVPEVRYTRWAGRSFDAFSTSTELNQVEAMISLTF